MKKKILLCFAIGLIIQSVLSSGLVFAEEQKIYTVDSADFDVVLNEDGSADITETWYVTYKKGSFTRFFKSIYFDESNADERCSSHIDRGVKIDGVPCEKVFNGSERKDYTYYIEDSGNEQMYNIYLASSGQTRKYELSYTRKDVVKRVNGTYYVFTHRFISKDFQKTVENVEVNIRAYDKNAALSVISKTSGEMSEGNEITINAKDTHGAFIVRAKIDGKTPFTIYTDSEISEADFGIISQRVSGYVKLVLWFILILLLIVDIVIRKCKMMHVVMMCIAIALTMINEEKVYYVFVLLEIICGITLLKNLYIKFFIADDMIKLNKIVQRWVPAAFSPAVFASFFGDNSYIKFFVALAEANAHGTVSFDKKLTKVTYCVDECKPVSDAFVISTLERIRKGLSGTAFVEAEPGQKVMLTLRQITHYLSDSARNHDTIVNKIGYWYYDCRNTKHPNGNFKLKKDVAILRRALQLTKVPYVRYKTIVNNPDNVMNMIFFCCYLPDKNVMKQEKTEISAEDALIMATVTAAYAAMGVRANSKSDSDGSSCSSCSSCGGGCGGCGGSCGSCGGAD